LITNETLREKSVSSKKRKRRTNNNQFKKDHGRLRRVEGRVGKSIQVI